METVILPIPEVTTVVMAPMEKTAHLAGMVAMAFQGGQEEMPPISMPWLRTATLTHTTLSLMAEGAGWEEKPAMAEQPVTAELGPMAAMESPAAVKLEPGETLALAPGAVMAVTAATAATVGRAAMQGRLRFRFRSIIHRQLVSTLAA